MRFVISANKMRRSSECVLAYTKVRLQHPCRKTPIIHLLLIAKETNIRHKVTCCEQRYIEHARVAVLLYNQDPPISQESSTMSNPSPVLLILGAGSNVGQHVSRAFRAKGYKVALTSRSLKEEESTADQIHISSDLSDPNSVSKVFDKVKASLGPPSVVVYNGN